MFSVARVSVIKSFLVQLLKKKNAQKKKKKLILVAEDTNCVRSIRNNFQTTHLIFFAKGANHWLPKILYLQRVD